MNTIPTNNADNITITEYQAKYDAIFKKIPSNKIKDDKPTDNRLPGMLGVSLSTKLDETKKKATLEEKYNIPIKKR